MKSKWTFELFWWISAVALSGIILFPIHISGIDFPFMGYNFFFIFFGVQVFRTLLFFPAHPLSQNRLFKFFLIALVPFILFPLIEGLHSFLEFNDQIGIQSVLNHLAISRQKWFFHYIPLEYVLFGMMSLIGSFLMIIKMIRSLWRQYKFGIV